MDSSFLDKPDKTPTNSEKEKKDKGEHHSETPSKSSWKNRKNKKRFFRKRDSSTSENRQRNRGGDPDKKSEIICFKCKKPGHIAPKCPEKKEEDTPNPK
jgi:hypothetical protein